jgi:hypothetical protein
MINKCSVILLNFCFDLWDNHLKLLTELSPTNFVLEAVAADSIVIRLRGG